MKSRIISFILSMFLMISIFPILSFASENITYTVVRDEVDGIIRQNIIINGQITNSANKDVRLIAFKKESPDNLSDSDIKAIEQVTADGNGMFSMTVSLIEGGEYVFEVFSNEMSMPYTFEFFIKDLQYYENIIDQFKASTDKNNTVNLINTSMEDLQLTEKYYNYLSGNGKDYVAELIVGKRNSLSLLNINDYFNEAVILSNLRYNENKAQIEEMISAYEDLYINLKDTEGAVNIYKTCFVDYPSIKDAVIQNLMKTKYDRLSDIKVKFRESVIVKAVQLLPIGDINSVITNNSDYLNLNYENLDNTAKSKILSYMLDNKSKILTKADFLYYYSKGYESLNNPAQNPQGPKGGGGGGTSVSVSPELIKNEKPEEYETIKMFTDLDSVPWAYEAIKHLFDNGIVSGKQSGLFYPNDYITREEFSKILAGALKLDQEAYDMNFNDVSADSWYYKYISYLKRFELIKGDLNGNFGVGQNITREDAATIIYRAITTFGLRKDIKELDKSKEFKDFDLISDYAKNSVVMLSNMGIISGMEDLTFAPKKNATRAEIATIIYKLIKM